MRPYFVEYVFVNVKGVSLRVCNTYPCFKLASLAFENFKSLPKVVEVRLYEQCINFDRLLDEYSKSK